MQPCLSVIELACLYIASNQNILHSLHESSFHHNCIGVVTLQSSSPKNVLFISRLIIACAHAVPNGNTPILQSNCVYYALYAYILCNHTGLDG